jgi:hypothetical protein
VNGFNVSVDGVKASGSGEVASPGTAITVDRETGKPLVEVSAAVTTVGDPVRIELDNGAVQPTRPITVAFNLDPVVVQRQLSTGREPMVLLSQPDGVADVVPAQWNPSEQTLVAQVPHLSLVWPAFFDVGGFSKWIGDGIKRVLGQTMPKPKCVGKTVDRATQSDYVTLVTDDVAWSCLGVERHAQEGNLRVELHPNSPYVWRVSTTPNFMARSVTGMDESNYPAGALYTQLLNQSNDSETFLAPGMTLSLEFGQYDRGPDSGSLQYDETLYVVGLLGYAVSWALEKFSPGKYMEMVENLQVIECLNGLSTAPDVTRDAGALGDTVKSVVGCVGLVGGETAKAIFSFIAGGLGAAVLGPMLSLVGVTPSTQSASFQVKSKPKSTNTVSEPILGNLTMIPNQQGYGAVKPPMIYNGGSGAGAVTKITWQSWGGATAQGKGYAWKGGADGREVPVDITAASLGDCVGVRAYKSLSYFAPSENVFYEQNKDICRGD